MVVISETRFNVMPKGFLWLQESINESFDVEKCSSEEEPQSKGHSYVFEVSIKSIIDELFEEKVSTKKKNHWILGPDDLNDTVVYDFEMEAAVRLLGNDLQNASHHSWNQNIQSASQTSLQQDVTRTCWDRYPSAVETESHRMSILNGSDTEKSGCRCSSEILQDRDVPSQHDAGKQVNQVSVVSAFQGPEDSSLEEYEPVWQAVELLLAALWEKSASTGLLPSPGEQYRKGETLHGKLAVQ
ncbi:hypothetical protein DNTS_027523, partial [Danionella cerebrum]